MKKAIYTVALGLIGSTAMAQVSLTTPNPTYSQDFNALANTGTAAHNLTTDINWVLKETLNGAQDDDLYRVNDGAGNTGNTYSYGVDLNTDRALGSLRSSSLMSHFGVGFVNNTGETITSVNIQYTGEQWRRGNTTSGRADTLGFYYLAGNLDSLNSASFTRFHALDFQSPVTPATASALDGNLAANQTAKSASISGLTIAPGSQLWIRWSDLDITGSDDGLAIDDVIMSFTTTGGGVVDTTARFVSATQSVNENAGTANINLIHSPTNAAGSAFSVDVVLKSGNAADLGNYTTQTVTFTPGTATKALAINVTDNLILDGNKTFVFALRNPSGVLQLGNDSLLTLTVVDNEVAPLPFYTIAHVRGANADGRPDSLGVKCRVAGKVYGVNLRTTGLQFYIHDHTAGMAVFAPAKTFNYNVTEGDSVIVEGEVGTFRGLAQMTFVDTVYKVGVAPIPAPIILSNLLGEAEEGELVQVNGLNLTSVNDWTNGLNSGSSFTVNATNGVGTYQIRVEKNTTTFSLAAPNTFFTVIGIGSQYATTNVAPYTDGYQIIPRKKEDIIMHTSNEESLKDALKVFPNPTSGEFNMVAFVNNAGSYAMSVIDMSGKTVFAKNLELTAGNNMISNDFTGFKPGIYHVRVLGAKGAFNTQFVIK